MTRCFEILILIIASSTLAFSQKDWKVDMSTSFGTSDFTRLSLAGDISASLQYKRIFVLTSFSAAMRRRVVNPIADYNTGRVILQDADELDQVSNFYHRRSTQVSRILSLQLGYKQPLGKRWDATGSVGWAWSWTEHNIFVLDSNEGLGPPFYGWYDIPRNINDLSFRLGVNYAMTERTSVGLLYMYTGAFSNNDLRMINIRTSLFEW